MRPKLRYNLILFLALLIFTIRAGLGLFFVSASDLTPQNIANAVNSERSNRNIATLNYNPKLAAAAQYKTDDMIARKYFAHVDPDGNYIWGKIAALGYAPYTILGENLAVDFSDTAGLVSAWIDSPTHRENMLNANFKDDGVGVTNGDPNQGQYLVAIANTFGAQPVVATPQPKVTAPVAKTPPKKVAVKPQTKSAETPAPKTQPQAPLPNPEIDLTSIKVNASVAGDKIDLNISLSADQNTAAVSATVLSATTQLFRNPDNTFTGDLFLDKYLNFQKQNLALQASGVESTNPNNVTVALSGVSVPADQNPKSLITNIPQKASQPDLYNLFKYVVIVFAILFLLFLGADIFQHFRHKKNGPGSAMFSGSNFMIFLILLGTVVLVNWWH